ncbi:MAG TPA: PadR family transcriptional regulator [Solirubrobacteraceae bacterium]|jgi:DNA-binding PadR family transcriptional regulator|nr:PadR family transcriptional regulator [Solirubrobacteraceae bacterium]
MSCHSFKGEHPQEHGPQGPHEHGRHQRRRHHGFGAGPFGPGPGGRGDFGGGRGPRGRGRKARRGDIRTAALLLLAEEPRNGYQIMQEVQTRSDEVWSPSPGSVYPALQQLEDEGLIRSLEVEGRKAYEITDEGRKVVAERGADRPAPWEEMSGDVSKETIELGRLMREVGFAFMQLLRTGSDAQTARAREVLTATRRDLYRILADGDEDATIVDGDA